LSLLLVDTTFLVNAERQGEDLDSVIADDDDVAIAAVTAAELLIGVDTAEGKRRTARQAFIDGVLDAVPVLPYDIRVARLHAELLSAVRESGRPRGAHDLIVAATAVASGRTVLSADPAAFDDLSGVRPPNTGTSQGRTEGLIPFK
jgi:tRNA(fMet)-specific endonuclease VapC